MVTRYPHGISSMGIPALGGIPPIFGKYFHVCPGATSNGSGLSKEEALADLQTAYGLCTSGAGDGIILWSYGTTTAGCTSYLTEELTWSKHGITVVGVCAPTMFAQRARVASASTATDLTHMIDVTGANNVFMNMSIGNYGSDATALGGIKVTSGVRNYFYNVHMIGACHATPAATAAANSLALSGASENTFERCIIGSDTINSVGTNATWNMSFASGCARNVFKDCVFLSQTTSGQAAHVAIQFVGAGDSINRTQYFDNCMFHNYNAGALSAQTSLVGGTSPNNGYIILHDCGILGYADADANSAAIVYSSRAASAADGGVMSAC